MEMIHTNIYYASIVPLMYINRKKKQIKIKNKTRKPKKEKKEGKKRNNNNKKQ